MPVSRRVSYILPAPSEPPPILQLPGIGERRRGVTQPYLVHKANAPNAPATNGTTPTNPFVSSTEQAEPNIRSHPRHCLGVNALALDTSTVLSDASAPGGILYSGGRDGLVVSWDLGIPHKRRRGQRYEAITGRTVGRTKWERVGDGAEVWDDDEDEDGFNDTPPDDTGTGNGNGNGNGAEADGWSSDDDLGDGWVGVDGDKARKRAARGEIPYEDRWEVDYDAAQESVSHAMSTEGPLKADGSGL